MQVPPGGAPWLPSLLSLYAAKLWHHDAGTLKSDKQDSVGRLASDHVGAS